MNKKSIAIVAGLLVASSFNVLSSGGKALSRQWKAGDKVEVQLGMQLREEATKDDASKVALVYGPIVMAGKLQGRASFQRPYEVQ